MIMPLSLSLSLSSLLGWTLLNSAPSTNDTFEIAIKYVANPLGNEALLISAYDYWYLARRDVWQSGNGTVPGTQPDWHPKLASVTTNTLADCYVGPWFDDTTYADPVGVPIYLEPGYFFVHNVYYQRERMQFENWQWSGEANGSFQTTVRRRDRWWELFADEERAIRLISTPGGGGEPPMRGEK